MNPAAASLFTDIISIIGVIINAMEFVVFVSVIVSWLVSFEVINIRNRGVAQIVGMIDNLSEVFLRPVRRITPHINGLDMSPFVFWIAAEITKALLRAAAGAAVGLT